MKNINLLSLVFFALFLNSAFSQESFITTKAGDRIVVDGAEVKLSDSCEKLRYQQLGSDKKSTISLDKITAAAFRDFRIETFSIEKKPRAYYIIAEMAEKKLVGYNEIYTETSFTGPGKSSINTGFKYFYFIIDGNNKVIESIVFVSFYTEKIAGKRDDAEAVLRKHFSDCPEFIARLNKYDPSMMNFDNASKRAEKFIKRHDEGNAKIVMLFNDPAYTKCNQPEDRSNTSTSETVTKAEPVLKADNATTSQYDGTYVFESISMDFRGSKRDMGIKGAYIIKDGFVEIKSKDNSPKYKIRNIKDGVIYCEDKNMVHTITVAPENGKKKGFEYDTKIVFTADPGLGGSVAEYLCKKG